jgi:hypothetical protein
LVTLTAWQCVPHLDVMPVPPFQRRLHPVVRFLQHIEQERSESMTRTSGQRRAKSSSRGDPSLDDPKDQVDDDIDRGGVGVIEQRYLDPAPGR